MTVIANIEGALYWYEREQYAKKTVQSYLNRLLADAGFDPRKDGIRLSVENYPYADDFEKPRLFLSTVRHSPTVSIQFESENATPEEIQRLVPYLKSFPELWERDMLKEAGFPEPTTAKDVALPYEGEATSIVLFVDSFIVGRLPYGLTFEEAVDRGGVR
nr:MAG TPA: hypothetical protein [Caudoviricetes sp.]